MIVGNNEIKYSIKSEEICNEIKDMWNGMKGMTNRFIDEVKRVFDVEPIKTNKKPSIVLYDIFPKPKEVIINNYPSKQTIATKVENEFIIIKDGTLIVNGNVCNSVFYSNNIKTTLIFSDHSTIMSTYIYGIYDVIHFNSRYVKHLRVSPYSYIMNPIINFNCNIMRGVTNIEEIMGILLNAIDMNEEKFKRIYEYYEKHKARVRKTAKTMDKLYLEAKNESKSV